jgi:hypothetical protein
VQLLESLHGERFIRTNAADDRPVDAEGKVLICRQLQRRPMGVDLADLKAKGLQSRIY